MQTNEFTFYELIIRQNGKSRSLYTFQRPDADNDQITIMEHTGILPEEMSIRTQGGKKILCEEMYGASAETGITKIVSRNGDATLMTEDGREIRACLPFDEFQKQYTRQAEEIAFGEAGAVLWTRDAESSGNKELVMQDEGGNEQVLADLTVLYEKYVSGAPVAELLPSLEDAAKEQNKAEDRQLLKPIQVQTYDGEIKDWEEIRNNIYIKTVCVTKNRELLKKVPSKIKGDFAAVLVLGTEDGYTNPLTNEHLSLLKAEKDYVFAKAIENTEKRYPIPKYFFSVYQTEVIDKTGDPNDAKYRRNQFYRKVRIIQDLRRENGHAVLFYPEFGETLRSSGKTTMYVIQDKDSYIAIPRDLEIKGYDSAREWCEEFISENNSDPDCPYSTYVHEFDPIDREILCNGKTEVDPEEKKPERRNFHLGR